MNILLPLSSGSIDDAMLVNLDKVVSWGFFDLTEGRVKKFEFYDDRNDIEEMIDCVIVASKDDYIWPFMEESIPILEAPVQREIDDIVEAFLFKELYEITH